MKTEKGIVFVHPDGKIELDYFREERGIKTHGKRHTPREFCARFCPKGTTVKSAILIVEGEAEGGCTKAQRDGLVKAMKKASKDLLKYPVQNQVEIGMELDAAIREVEKRKK